MARWRRPSFQEIKERLDARVRRWRLVAVLLLLGWLGLWGWSWVRRTAASYRGAALARRVCAIFNENRRGRMEIASITWEWTDLPRLLEGAPIPIVIRHLRLYDVRGEPVFYAPRIEATFYVGPLLLNGSVVFGSMDIPKLYVRVETFPDPASPGKTVLGLTDLFAEAYPTPPGRPLSMEWSFTIHRLRVKEMDTVLAFPSVTGELRGPVSGALNLRIPKGTITLLMGYDLVMGELEGVVNAAGTELPVKGMRISASQPAEKGARGVITVGTSLAGSRIAGAMETGPAGTRWRMTVTGWDRIASRFSPVPIHRCGSQPVVSITGRAGSRTVVRVSAAGGCIVSDGMGAELHALDAEYRSVKNESMVLVDRLLVGTTMGSVLAEGDLDPSSMVWHAAALLFAPALPGGEPYARSALLDVHGTGRGGQSPISLQFHARGAGFPYSVATVSGAASYDPTEGAFTLRRLTVGAPHAQARVRGRGTVEPFAMSATVRLLVTEASRYLAAFSIPVSAKGIRASAGVRIRDGRLSGSGTWAIDGVTYRGVAVTSLRGRAEFSPSNGTVVLEGAQVAGGKLTGRIGWAPGALDATVRMVSIAPGTLVPGIKGRFGGELHARGPFSNPRVWGVLRSQSLAYQGYEAKNVSVSVAGTLLAPSVEASARLLGGRFMLRARTRRGSVSVHTTMDHLKLELLAPGAVTGEVNWNVAASAQGLTGVMNGEHITVLGKRYPPVRISLSSAGGTGQVHGTMGDLLRLDADYTMSPPSASLRLRIPPVPLRRLVPDALLAGLVDGRVGAEASVAYREGTLSYSGEVWPMEISLLPKAPSTPAYTLKLAGPLSFSGRDGSFAMGPGLVTGGLTRLWIWGEHQGTDSMIRLRGDVDVSPVSMYLPPPLREMRGLVSTELQLELGPDAGPRLYGKLFFGGNTLVTDYGTVVLRAGRISFEGRTCVLDGLRFEVGGELLRLSGRLTLAEDLSLEEGRLRLTGRLPARLLSDLAPDLVFYASGGLFLDAEISLDHGKWSYRGRIVVEEPVEVSLRSGMDLRLSAGGSIVFDPTGVRIENVVAGVDDGALSIAGSIPMEHGTIKGVSLQLDLTGVPYHVPATLDGEISGHLSLSGPLQSMSLSGALEIQKARYYKKFKIDLTGALSGTEEGGTESVLDRYPFLKNISMDVSVALHGDVQIDNNLMETNLDGMVQLKGTVGKPQFRGALHLLGGWFRIPMLRGTYELEEGVIDLDRAGMEGRPRWEPYFLIRGQMPYVDRSDEEIAIYLTIEGYLSELKLEWASSNNMTSSQVLTLLMSGRTPEEIRQGGGGMPDLGGLLEGFIPVDVQLGITSDAIQVAVRRKYWNNHVVVRGKVEMGFMGRQEQEASVQLRVHDRVALQAMARRRTYEERVPTEGEQELRGRLEVKYSIHFMGTLWDMLGL